MKWLEFVRAAYPQAKEASEVDHNVVFRANRWLGLRIAYLLYHLRISAGLITVLRLVLAVGGFYLVSQVAIGARWMPVVGAMIIGSQIHLDFVDGPIARIRGEISNLGEKLDGLPNAASRAVALILAGYLTSDVGAFLSSTFSAYVLVVFIPDTGLRVNRVGRLALLSYVYSVLLYVPAMAFVLPLMIGVHGLLGIDVATFSRWVVATYSGLAMLWLILCLLHSERSGSPLERATDLG